MPVQPSQLPKAFLVPLIVGFQLDSVMVTNVSERFSPDRVGRWHSDLTHRAQ